MSNILPPNSVEDPIVIDSDDEDNVSPQDTHSSEHVEFPKSAHKRSLSFSNAQHPLINEQSVPIVQPLKAKKLRTSKKAKLNAEELEEHALVEVTHPPPLGSDFVWTSLVSSMLPKGILKKTQKKKGTNELKPMQDYEPCTWNEFIVKTNEKTKAKAKRILEKRIEKERVWTPPSSGSEDDGRPSVMKHIEAVKQAQVAIYGNDIDAVDFTRWD